jgi:phenylalanyl-tRNA synthetase alpha chain
MYKLTKEGKKYLETGLPEKRLLDLLKEKEIPVKEAREKIKEFSIALMWAKKNKWIYIENNYLKLLEYPAQIPEQVALEKISRGEPSGESIISILVSRNLVEKERENITKKAEKYIGREIDLLPPELIKTGLWKKVSLKKYNVKFSGKKIYPGKYHILTQFVENIRKIFMDLGFTEASGPLIESSFWNFDALYQPQDHPARDLADTFYMKSFKSKLPEKGTVKSVKAAHENGGNTGSTGWRYKWSEEIAKQPILRTHTTSVSARMLSEIEPPAKVFCIGRVFRNETINYKSLTQFTQIEGIVVDENVGFRDLLGYLKEFYNRMGFEKIRFRPAYFPYTEMSVEPEIWFKEKKQWVEMGGSGIFRPEVTEPLGITEPVLAWGLGLERLVMLSLGLSDIRKFHYTNDIDLLRSTPLWLKGNHHL